MWEMERWIQNGITKFGRKQLVLFKAKTIKYAVCLWGNLRGQKRITKQNTDVIHYIKLIQQVFAKFDLREVIAQLWESSRP